MSLLFNGQNWPQQWPLRWKLVNIGIRISKNRPFKKITKVNTKVNSKTSKTRRNRVTLTGRYYANDQECFIWNSHFWYWTIASWASWKWKSGSRWKLELDTESIWSHEWEECKWVYEDEKSLFKHVYWYRQKTLLSCLDFMLSIMVTMKYWLHDVDPNSSTQATLTLIKPLTQNYKYLVPQIDFFE